jgi:hypothetical protein
MGVVARFMNSTTRSSPLLVHSFPIQATVLDALSGKVEGVFVEQHVEKTGGQGEEIIATLDRRTALDAVAGIQGIAAAHRVPASVTVS